MTPDDLPTVNRKLKAVYATVDAPIIELIRAQTQDPFRILVATLLSARTKDGTTAVVCDRLFAKVKKASDFRKLSESEVAKLIFPVGFYRTKAKHLKQMPDVLDERFGGEIPQNIDALCELPGVGRKTANLVMIAAFDKHAMCVDTHVHRISNRLGLIETANPTESEMALREVLPKRYWKAWNRYLVAFGQTRCRPIGPKCGGCPLESHCSKIDVKS
jgi:endonuclease III